MKTRFKISYNSPVVLTFVLLCLLVLLMSIGTHRRSTTLLFMTYHSSLFSPLTYLRFLPMSLGTVDGNI